MDRDEKLRFSKGGEDNDGLGPELIGFRGTQAERYVENLKVSRNADKRFEVQVNE